ncbi:RNA polymerase sigma-70 factor [Mucilaginibacter limnophilus]|uniref:RNA polymerase sigma-70 factor n=1 Tax=Mucilaginibacter limnophilus TaxID=1932778 RepID=A0A3S2V3Y7_9SPHI|nr:RNA polymerase sigma-70 factor [Mucilaginibacter limnophilus]RVU02786.1 RNA polymerase sigma-70 factor [Mucilaginibacter limnophilus]
MRSYAEVPDIELLKLLCSDEDVLAFNEIYNRYWDKAYGAAYKRTKLTEVSEEIVQDIFTDLWLRRKELQITAKLPVYLFSAVRYKVINYIHKELLKSNHRKLTSISSPDLDNSTEERVIAGDLHTHLQLEVRQLPEKCREVFELSRNEYKSNREIAQSLGISEKTVENHITKALRRLRTSINSFFL